MFNSLNFYRYIRNYLTISAQGGFSERFLNLCNKNKISIWNLNFNKNGFTANVYGKDFSRIRHVARKSGVSLKIISKSGLHFSLHKHRKRKGLLIGAIFALFFMLLMNLFVWEIEITGSENISREKVMSVIKKVGLEYGTFSPAFDRIDASRNAINIFDGDILWMAINIKGSKATVEIREMKKAVSDNSNTNPSNLMADFDGILIQTETHSGVQNAYSGELVSKGEILISGIYENEDGSTMYQHSEGCFSALHQKTLEKNYNDELEFKAFSEEKICNAFDAFGIRIPLSHILFSDNHIYSYNSNLTYANKPLPFYVVKHFTAEYKKCNESILGKLYYIDAFTVNEYEKMKNTLIINRKYTLTNTEGIYNINCDYKCIDYIGKSVPIIITD